MSFSSDSGSRDTSPDPIVLPSSPLGGNNNRSARKATPRRPNRKVTRGSPSKSLILDTPNGAGGESPWRIRVTVEAEPREGTSPGRKRRSTSPRKKTTSSSSSTTTTRMKTVPLKVESPEQGTSTAGNTRKRKGTPIRRGRSTRHQPPPLAGLELVGTVENDQDGADFPLQEMGPPPVPSSDRRRTSGRIGRLNSQSAPTLRSQRLSLAREELDIALQDAVGYGEEYNTTRLLGEVDFSKSTTKRMLLGDATLSRNEDFSMVSVETLQTAKDSSLVSSGLGNSTGSGTGYIASSPPKRDALRRSVLGEPVQFGRSTMLGRQADSGRSSALGASVESSGRRSTLGSSVEPGTSERRDGADVMSWRATGPAIVLRHETPSSQLKPGVHMRPSTGSQPNQVSQSYGMDGADDEDISQGIDLDIWQDEASRSLEEHPEEDENVERETEEGEEKSEQDELQADDQLQSDAAAQAAAHSPDLEDIFANQPLKPARGKIPKTWRRSSGMDFSYVDSPAHGLVDGEEQPVGDERRHSADGSGVLTPPSTSEEEDEEEEVVNVGEERREADELGDEMEYEEDGSAGEQFQYDQEEAQSEWNQPDAEATRYEGQRDELALENDDARNDSASPLSDGNTDDDDTGGFFQSNMPAVFARQNRPRRPRPRPRGEEGTVDLTDLLGLKSSPIKPAGPAASASFSSSTRPARTTQLRGGPYDGKMKLNPPQQEGSGEGAKLVDSPLRRSLLKSSKMHGGSPDQKRQLHHHQIQAPAPAMKSFIVPAQTQQAQHHPRAYHNFPELKDSTSTGLSPAVLDRSQTRFPNSQSRVEVELDSFASKDSDQRQLLTEMTPRVGTGVGNGHTGQSYEGESEGLSSPAPIMRSYEENLNVESPQKIPVHFGDSSSVLPPTKLFLSQAGRKSVGGNQYRPERQPVQQQTQASKQPLALKPIAVVDRRVPDVGKKLGGMLSRLSETFWSAVIRPTGPTEIMPNPEQQRKYYQPQQNDTQDSTEYTHTSDLEEEEYSDEGAGMFNTTLRTAIRNRYGVLPSTFPWTMAHMRTLHRMLNSLLSTRPDSLIPNAGPLPAFLEGIVDTTQESVIGKEFVFTREHAYVVFSFVQILVEEKVVSAMEQGQVEMLGDETSRMYRGVLEGDERKGWEKVFLRKRGEGRWAEEGEIGWEFVVGCVGCVVRCEEVASEAQMGRGRERA